jgi:FkbM family methyltransferase
MHGVASSVLTLQGLSDGRTVDVRTKTIDTWCEETGSVPALIKIDAEGTEPLILEGARETMRRHRPVLIFELW